MTTSANPDFSPTTTTSLTTTSAPSTPTRPARPTTTLSGLAAVGVAVIVSAVLALAGVTPAAAAVLVPGQVGHAAQAGQAGQAGHAAQALQPVPAAPAAPAVPAAPASATDVNDFSFESFSAVYTLSRDDAGRSLLQVEETLVAQFPDFDQNRGIRRELVERFDGRPTDIELISVTDGQGQPREYDTESNDDFLEVTIAGDDYVRGTQIYVITYLQHNVTRFFDNTNAEEFYWDTNGTGWPQSFGSVTARIEIDPELAPSLTGEFAAYVGYEGSTTPATIAQTDTGFIADAQNLAAYENVTVSIAFEPGTFTPRDSSFAGAPWPLLSLLGAIGSLGAVIGAAVLRRTKLKDAPGRGTIIPEYVAPKGVNIPLSSVISGTTTKVTAAQIVSLAVAGNITVLVVEGSGRKPKYALRFVTADGAGPVETEFLHALFGATLQPGEDHSLEAENTKTATKITKIMQRVTKGATTAGYRRALPAGAIALVCMAALVATSLAFIFGVMALDQSYGGFVPGITLGLGFLGLFVVIGLVSKVPLEARGTELREYLLGLKMYISLAEADRLQYLQSPEGAERTPVAVDDTAQILKLNEKLLPHAILFGLEKQWTAELGTYYEQTGTQPTWYSGSTGFNAAIFASSMSSLSSSVSSSYSSSSGGSSGGGSSGGGGGGGGGGGV